MANDPSTIGLEFESIVVERDRMAAVLDRASGVAESLLSVTRDASVESFIRQVGSASKLFLGNNKLVRNPDIRSVAGYELVTRPLVMDNMRSLIRKIVAIQVSNGEIFSPRSSIHVHVGFPPGLIFNKAALAFGELTEPLFFKLAGMGREFRGETNNSAYCRPWGLPPAIPLSDAPKFAMINTANAIESAGSDNFWWSLGISPNERDRYIPIRYMGMNVYSNLLRGTMEYRFFNFSTVAKHIEAVTALCQLLTDTMVRSSLSDVRRIKRISIFERNSDNDYIQMLDELVSLSKYNGSKIRLTKDDYQALNEIIELSPQPVFINKPISTHVRNTKLDLSRAVLCNMKIISEAAPAGIIDVHNFNYESRKLIGDT